MSSAKNCPETPRQRMIGMMYLVLTAMLALNVSTEILNGFSMVDNSLHTTIETSNTRNKLLYASFQDLSAKNPTKVREWLDKAITVKHKSDSLFNYIQDFKYQIVKAADRKHADPNARNIIAQDNLDVAGEYALVKGNGKILKKKIGDYRQFLMGLSSSDLNKQKMYQEMFATERSKDGKSWEQAMFDMMPVSAVVTILTKYQSDVRLSEAEMVQYLKAQTDVSDFRVNRIQALVVPNTRYVIRGDRYSAKIVLSAVDTTLSPQYFIGGSSIRNGLYEINCGRTGAFNYSGQIRMPGNDGIMHVYPFSSDYIVGEPTATLSNEALNVVYRGIDNLFSISVPGVPNENVSVRIAGGTVTKTAGGKFIVRATQDGDINISVFAKIEGKERPMGGGSYRVKYLPDPKSFIQYTDAGGIVRQIQDGNLTKRILKSNVAVVASYGPDELIKANFTVTSFTMVTPFGSVNATGSHLNSRQLADIDRLEGGDYLTFKNIKAVGPDGKVRSNLGLLQVQI